MILNLLSNLNSQDLKELISWQYASKLHADDHDTDSCIYILLSYLYFIIISYYIVFVS